MTGHDGGSVRIAMWSGPRNLSTALMRAFENRPDCEVVDEPFYAAYLQATGLAHPLRAEVLRSQPIDWRRVVAALRARGGSTLIYEKHMTHHMVPGFGRDWLAACRNAFLIRRPAPVLMSYVARREECSLDDIGFRQQADLFDETCDRLGRAPPVIDATDLRTRPEAVLRALCRALGIGFVPEMLHWPAGPRATDGVWAPAWYGAVERSTGFVPPSAPDAGIADLPLALQALGYEADLIYQRLAAYRL